MSKYSEVPDLDLLMTLARFGLSSPPTDWRAKYNEAADMLSEARNELDDFVHSSKELEEELLRELERTEKTQKDLKDRISRIESDRDDWKNKYISLQTNHNTTVNSLHRELDTLRKEHQKLKVQFRELEMGNDDLERTERAISSSLADTEAKYSRVLEEKIILEQELLNKARIEEEAQRLRDEVRDANSEVQVLRDQLDHHKATLQRHSLLTPPATDSSCSPKHDNGSALHLPTSSNDDQLLDTVAPADVLLADDNNPLLAPPKAPRTISNASSNESIRGQKLLFPRPGLSGSGLHSRSNSLRASPSKPSGSLAARSPRGAPVGRTNTSAAPSKSKGVQMVSEMRARVRNLEQKLQTRVPRLRSGTFERGGNSPAIAAKKKVEPESPGWVLVMEESPQGKKTTPMRKDSLPPTSFSVKSPRISNDESPIASRGPIPRRSFTSNRGRTSIPTPTSRSGSPDFNPPPIDTRSLNALKRTSVPLFSANSRASLGSSTDSRDGPLSLSQRSSNTVRGSMGPPPIPAGKPLSISALGTSKFSNSSSLGASRIGRPMSLSSRRTDTGPSTKHLPVDEYGMISSDRPRSARSGSVSQFGADGETF
ncbi:hypothetical protein CPB86DRAFT_720900 [Serendipita vermifera]|nr:hypothetical protein CPB86DRAFT_720900 [Serendipita vermifera]